MLRIVYRDYEFTDASHEIISVQGSLRQSLIADALSADDCIITVKYDPAALGYYINGSSSSDRGFLYTVNGETVMVRTSDSQTIDGNLAPFESDFTNAEPVDIYDDEVFFKRFYVTQALPVRTNRDGTVLIQLKAVSFIGLTVYMSHNGGIYTNSTVGAIIAEILKGTKNNSKSTSAVYWYDMPSDLHYTMDSDVAKVRSDGYLPITDRNRSARDNIRDVCFGYGISMLQQTDGSAHFTFNQPSEVINIPDAEIYLGDGYSNQESVTEVKVVANTYRQYSGESSVVLWESTDVVSNAKVIFDRPCWGLSSSQIGGVDTITVVEQGVNYAVISGTGTLYGIPYLHTQEEFRKVVGTGAENIKTGDCGMVSLLNYQHVLNRMANYYGNAREIAAAFVVNRGISTGSLVGFNDPHGHSKTGVISSIDFNMSEKLKGDSRITTDWVPTDVGNNFTMSQVLTGSGTWTKAAAEAAVGHAIDIVRFDIIGGGDGGSAGADGEAGTANKGGRGGAAGAGGQPGKVLSVTFEGNAVPSSVSFVCGSGGNPGAVGGASRITAGGTTYSSENGVRTQAGYMDLITGEVRAILGPDGIAGGDGGEFDGNDLTHLRGGSVTYKGRTWSGGTPGSFASEYRYNPHKSGSSWIFDNSDYVNVVGAPSTTGGAAFGANSADGTNGSLSGYNYYGSNRVIGISTASSGISSAGADASPTDDYTPALGSGGSGGNGGGGGGQPCASRGAGGYRYLTIDNEMVSISGTNSSGTAGLGGQGSLGTKGGAGFITAYV